MSRKWERMVEKNKAAMNKQRTKQGKKPIGTDTQRKVPRVLGRNWSLPILLLGVAFFFMLTVGGAEGYEKDGMYWVTVIGYVLLALFIFFLRRPYLKISDKQVATRKWNGEKRLKAEDIESIVIQAGYVIIQPKSSKARWVFSKLFQRFNTEQMASLLKAFATKHSISYQDESHGKGK